MDIFRIIMAMGYNKINEYVFIKLTIVEYLGVGWSFKHNIIQWADKGNR
jgi:hypothetical protein